MRPVARDVPGRSGDSLVRRPGSRQCLSPVIEWCETPPHDRQVRTSRYSAAAFDERIFDLDFHMNPTEEQLLEYVTDDAVREKLSTELALLPRTARSDAAYAIPGGNEGLFTQGKLKWPST